eukprot:XP_011674588.1 PREDICTED: dynein light chain 1, cytoplasmic-like [Strongylocentrotus purpuratus]
MYSMFIHCPFLVKTRSAKSRSRLISYYISWIVNNFILIMSRSGRSGSSFMSEGNKKQDEVVVKNVDMAEDLQEEAIQAAQDAMTKSKVEKDVAAAIKKKFDDEHQPTWHCIVGRNFGSYVTHESKHFIYFYIGQKAFLLFKSG